MKHNIIRYSMIVLLIGIVALSTAQSQTDTEQTRQVTLIQDLGAVGLVYGQALRVNVFNPLAPPSPGEDGRQYQMLCAVTLFDADGRVLAHSDEITLAPEQFHSFNFNRSDLTSAGEAGTGRLQVRSEVRRRFVPGFAPGVRVALGDVNNSLGAVELVDNGTGKTLAATFASQGPYVITSVQHSASVLLGLTPGQTLRVTLAHVSGPAGQNQTPPDVQVGVWLLDSSGRVIAQSAQVPIPRNEFHSFDFNRAALGLPGEAGTGRLQVRARLMMNVAEPYRFTDDPRATFLLVPSLELVDNSTGRTAVGKCCQNNLKQLGLATH